MSATLDTVIRALESDPEAIQALLNFRVECNEKLANDPTIQVGEVEGGGYDVSALGLINGILAANDLQLLIACYDRGDSTDLDKGRGKLVRFMQAKPEEDSESEPSPPEPQEMKNVAMLATQQAVGTMMLSHQAASQLALSVISAISKSFEDCESIDDIRECIDTLCMITRKASP